MPTIVNEKIVFNNKLIVEEAQIRDHQNQEYTRLRLKRQDASAVLLFNTATHKIILTQQFRYPIADQVKENLLEIMAGKVDEGETPLDAAIREAEEETGYCLKKGNIRFLLTCFASPGYSSERFHLYYATVSPEDLQSQGGGLASEQESIQLVELELEDFKAMIRDGRIQDAKTILAGLYAFTQETL
ncbi:MAG: ADP-ribose pyrophosphatase [Chitinophagaceae bacterium]|nr:ADP-ribose pyrophosphatase [Chitinophagaceae bacterium]